MKIKGNFILLLPVALIAGIFFWKPESPAKAEQLSLSHPPIQVAAVPDPATVEEIPIKLAEASSVLTAQLGGHPKDFFGPRKAIDNDWTTCWAEGVEGIGHGEWIKVVWLTKEVPAYIALVPGWAKTKARWENNPRLLAAEISLSNGFRQPVKFDDQMQLQFVKLQNELPAEWAQITIQSVYEGKKFQDTSISEIKVFKQKKAL